MPGWTTERRESVKRQRSTNAPMTITRRTASGVSSSISGGLLSSHSDDDGLARRRISYMSDVSQSASRRSRIDSEIEGYLSEESGTIKEESEEEQAEKEEGSVINEFQNDDDDDDDDDSDGEAPGAYAVTRENEQEDPSQEWDPTAQTEPPPQPSINENSITSTSTITTPNQPPPETATVQVQTLLPLSSTSASASQRAKRNYKLVLILLLVGCGAFLIGLFVFRLSFPSKNKRSDEDAGPCHFSKVKRQFAPFESTATPNPFDQCQCEGSIRYVADETQTKYGIIKQELGFSNVIDNANDQINSCGPQNLALVWLASYANATTLSSQTTVTQRFVLSYMYAILGKEPWPRRNGWLDPNVHECDWFGISCDNFFRITRISLPGQGIKGTMTTELAQYLAKLTKLRILNLEENGLEGPLPLVPQLRGLHMVDLGANQFTGNLPDSLGGWTDLTFLDIGSNRLSGSLPRGLFLANQLKHLSLEGNTNIVGTIPGNIGLLTMLTYLSMKNTQLEGQIPTWIGTLTNLEGLALSNQLLSGTLPTEIQHMTNLVFFEMEFSGIRGTIPTEIKSMTSLEELTLSVTKLEGQIPTEIGLLSKLEILDFESTNLGGTIPSEIGNLSNLRQLNLRGLWKISGTLPRQVAELPKLVILDLVATKLHGSLMGNVPVCTEPGSILVWPCTMECGCCRSGCCEPDECAPIGTSASRRGKSKNRRKDQADD